jgi:hypothetical protein
VNGHVGVFVFGNAGWPYFPYGYPYYPYVIDPGFYDWSLPGDDPAYGQGGSAGNYAPYADNGGAYSVAPQEQNYAPEPYPEQPSDSAPAPSGARPAYAGAVASTAPRPQEPLTVIFKNGRAPVQIQNYIMNAKSLTNLDQRRYEQIPLDQIDIAATEQINRARGIEFRVPDSTRD